MPKARGKSPYRIKVVAGRRQNRKVREGGKQKRARRKRNVEIAKEEKEEVHFFQRRIL